MALMKCGECGRDVSDKAAACPNCGAPVSVSVPDRGPAKPLPPSLAAPVAAPGARLGKSGCLGVGLMAVVLIAVINGLLSNSDPAPAATTQAAPPAPVVQTEEQRVADLASAVATLDDPQQSAGARLARVKHITANHAGTPEATRAQAMVPELEEALRKESLGRQWRYSRSEDAMSGKTATQASVLSTNQFEFQFPYGEPQRATLAIRHHPRWGKNVVFSIERGQILCSSYSSCPIRVRFDEGTPRTLSGNEPADNSTETVFIPGYGDFMARLAKAKRVRIEVNVHQQGTLMAEFDVSDLNRSKFD